MVLLVLKERVRKNYREFTEDFLTISKIHTGCIGLG